MKIELKIDGKEIELSKKTLKSIKKQIATEKKLTYDQIKPNAKTYIEYGQDWVNMIMPQIYKYKAHIHYNNYTNQIEHLLCLNKLINVAKYLNDKENDKKFPDWNDVNQYKFTIMIDNEYGLYIDHNTDSYSGSVYFKTKKLAQQSIEILGEETIRKALTLNF